MTENRLGDYLGHMRQAAADALIFIEGLSKEEFSTTSVHSRRSS